MERIFNKFLSEVTILVIVLLNVLIVTSCTSEEESSIANESAEFANLRQNLSSYSEEFVKNSSQQGSRWGGWHRFWDSIRSDFYGYSIQQATVFSVSTSREKWLQLKKVDENLDLITSTNPSHQTLIQNRIDSLEREYRKNPLNKGALHNALVYISLLDQDLIVKDNLELALSVDRAARKFNVTEEKWDVKTLPEEIDYFFENVYDENPDIMINNIIKEQPERKEEIELLRLYFDSLQKLDSLDEMSEYTQDFIRTVRSSKISEGTKNSIISNISIATASLQLWNDIENYIK